MLLFKVVNVLYIVIIWLFQEAQQVNTVLVCTQLVIITSGLHLAMQQHKRTKVYGRSFSKRKKKCRGGNHSFTGKKDAFQCWKNIAADPIVLLFWQGVRPSHPGPGVAHKYNRCSLGSSSTQTLFKLICDNVSVEFYCIVQLLHMCFSPDYFSQN